MLCLIDLLVQFTCFIRVITKLCIQVEYERRLLTLCDEGTVDEKEVLYLLSQLNVNPNVYDEVMIKATIFIIVIPIIGQALHPPCPPPPPTVVNCMTLLFFSQCGRTSLWYASYHGRIDLIRILIEYGADVNLPTDVSLSKRLPTFLVIHPI